MKTEEINRVNRNLAEFEGLEFKTISGAPVDALGEELDYTNDLNALVPIWEKLNYHAFRWDWLGDHGFNVCLSTNEGKAYSKGKTIQQAAALATEKAILALEGGK